MTHRGNSDKSVASRSTGRSSSRIGLAGCESPPAAGVPDILSGSGTAPNAAGAAVAPSATADAAAVPRGFADTQPRVAAVAGWVAPAAPGKAAAAAFAVAGFVLVAPASGSSRSASRVVVRVPVVDGSAPAGAG